jgi:hypothetical protein
MVKVVYSKAIRMGGRKTCKSSEGRIFQIICFKVGGMIERGTERRKQSETGIELYSYMACTY